MEAAASDICLEHAVDISLKDRACSLAGGAQVLKEHVMSDMSQAPALC